MEKERFMVKNATRRTVTALLVVSAAGSIVIGVRAAQDSPAQAAPAQRFQRVPLQSPFATSVKPRVLDTTLVKVVAVLAGDSVAQTQEVTGRRLTRQEKNDVKAQRRAEQAAVRTSLEGAGGRVENTFQSAINGIKLSIPRNRIEELRNIPGVVDVKPVGFYRVENAVSVPRTQAPTAWSGALGVRGEGVKIAIIDTGIDYTHANFGGPGTPAAYQAAHMHEKEAADPAMFGPNAPKVKGGIDLVGDNYNPGSDDPAANTPMPDPNPLDCDQDNVGHGSHVAGSAAGFGVTAQGTTFNGPYDQNTHTNFAFTIGPGVAPKADLYAVRVFGCSGGTDVVTEALDWAVDNDMDVVNMSLGADFGTGDDADSIAADNAVKAGVVVVIAAGNAGDIRYVLGSPGASTRSITVAASAKEAFDTTVNMALPATPAGAAAKTIQAINANGASFSPGSLEVKVLRNPNGTVSLGCNRNEYVAAGVTGKLVVTQRGTCARVARAIFGQQAGAAAVVMINNATSLPPFEGPITSNPDTGEPFVVTIPFYGVRGPAANPASDGFALVQRDGMSIALTEGTPIQTGLAGFTSGGPRTPDSLLKPDVTGPGVAIVSTGVGTGNGSLTLSGTSMATPHVAGMAALVIQAHPRWRPAAIKSAIMNSADPGGLSDYETRRAGVGFINAAAAVGTMAYAFADRDETTLNFGLDEFPGDFSKKRTIRIKNDGATANFDVTVSNKQGSPHTVTVSPTHITVPKHGTAEIELTLMVPGATAGNSQANPPADFDAFHDVAGLVTFTPSMSSNRGIALRVPYYLVPRPSANVNTNLSLRRRATVGVANVQNRNSAIAGTAEFFAWGLSSRNDKLGRIDLRAAGVESIDFDGTDRILVFAVNTFRGWSSAEQEEFDVPIDVNGDGSPDFVMFNLDPGLLGDDPAFTGQQFAAVLDLNTGALFADFFSIAATNSSTILLPVLASSLGVTPANPRITYSAIAFDLLSNDSDAFEEAASFNVFTPAISNGDFVEVAPDAFVSVAVTINPAEAAITPAKGLMIVTPDNKNGAKEADLITVRQ
jgi:minor extracellular serine protease Vpr